MDAAAPIDSSAKSSGLGVSRRCVGVATFAFSWALGVDAAAPIDSSSGLGVSRLCVVLAFSWALGVEDKKIVKSSPRVLSESLPKLMGSRQASSLHVFMKRRKMKQKGNKETA